MANIFTKVKVPGVRESKFNLSHDVKMSFNMGTLNPCMLIDVLPGDKFKINTESMLRFGALISPVMHNIKVICNFFFVPNRILWDGWEDFITGTNTDDPPPHFQDISQIQIGHLGDYLGIPTDATAIADQQPISAFPVAAYIEIYNYWYRSQDLQPEIDNTLVSGNNVNIRNIARENPLKRAKNHDYFTSSLPFAQKGDSVTLPLLQDEEVPVQYKFNNQSGQTLRYSGGGNEDDPIAEGEAWTLSTDEPGATGGLQANAQIDSAFAAANLDLGNTHTVNINEEASTVETLRKAFRLQEWLEKNARGGTRYSEHLKSHFAVSAQDSRLQNPEYIGGSVHHMIISEVLNTAGDPQGAANAAVGEMSGHGIAVGKGKTFKYSAKEHGWIMGIISVTPNTAYQQGLHRSLMRSTILDYAFPSFANLGEQEILNYEIYVGGQSPTPEEGLGTFGYIPRYAEYKYVNNRVAGDFRETLDHWHCGLKFDTAPALNSDFIETHTEDYDKIFAVDSTTAHTIYGHIFNNVSAIRKLPKYGIPTI